MVAGFATLMNCSKCRRGFHFELEKCPKCATPSPEFPNVYRAKQPDMRVPLEKDYQEQVALAQAEARFDKLQQFEAACKTASILIGRSAEEILALLRNPDSSYISYYKKVASSASEPGNNDWDRDRVRADTFMFQQSYGRMHFALLSLNGKGLRYYGDCFIEIQEEDVGHRAIVARGNTTATLIKQNVGIRDPMIPGFFAVWAERSKLCVAKLGERIAADMPESEFEKILVEAGSQGDDEFVEVLICDPIASASIRKVTYCGLTAKEEDDWIEKGLRQVAKKRQIPVEVVA